MTEKEAREWLRNSMYITDWQINEFLRIGKERGYIEKSALERARDEMKDFKERENIWPSRSIIFKVADLYEQAVKEAKEE